MIASLKQLTKAMYCSPRQLASSVWFPASAMYSVDQEQALNFS